MYRQWRALWRDQSGQGLVEYALLLGLAALAAAGVWVLGRGAAGLYDRVLLSLPGGG